MANAVAAYAHYLPIFVLFALLTLEHRLFTREIAVDTDRGRGWCEFEQRAVDVEKESVAGFEGGRRRKWAAQRPGHVQRLLSASAAAPQGLRSRITAASSI